MDGRRYHCWCQNDSDDSDVIIPINAHETSISDYAPCDPLDDWYGVPGKCDWSDFYYLETEIIRKDRDLVCEIQTEGLEFQPPMRKLCKTPHVMQPEVDIPPESMKSSIISNISTEDKSKVFINIFKLCNLLKWIK